MDSATSLYRSKMRPFRDRPDIEIPGRWYWCPEGAIALPFAHAFGSYRLDDFRVEDEPVEVGELSQWDGLNTHVANSRYTGQHWCGSREDWQLGAIFGQTLQLDAEGVPLCCREGGLRPGGGAIVVKTEVFPSCDLCAVWLDPSTLAYGTVGATYEFWERRWCTARDAQYISGPVTHLAADPSGYNAISFPSTSGGWGIFNFSTPVAAVGDFTVWMVGRMTVLDTGGPWISQSRLFDDMNLYVDHLGIHVHWGFQGFDYTAGLAPVLHDLHIYAWSRVGSTWRVYCDGVLWGTVTGPTTITGFTYFQVFPNATILTGNWNLLEVMVIPEDLSLNLQGIIWQYLLAKYKPGKLYFPAMLFPLGYFAPGYFPF